jgi:hypothetical protein
MTATSGKQLAVGVRRAVIFELDTNGYPAASGTSAYEGIEVAGPKAFTLTVPDARKITHVGNDRVLALDYLPPTEGVSGELRVASNDMVAKAAVTNVNTFAVGEATLMPWGTDQQGFEVDAGLLLFQQSLDTSTKSRRWKFYVMPKARLIPGPASMDENPAEDKYTVAPNPTTNHLWGTALASGTEGATEMALAEGMAEGKPNIVAFKGNNSTTAFLLPTAKPATSVAKMKVWVNGVPKTTGGGGLASLSTTTITFSSAPATGAMVVVFYEY